MNTSGRMLFNLVFISALICVNAFFELHDDDTDVDYVLASILGNLTSC